MKYIQKRKKLNAAIATLDRIASSNGITKETAALEVVKNRLPIVEDYVASHGVIPAKNPASLAIQATLIHEDKINEKMDNGISNYIEAENAVFMDEADNYDGEEVSNFLSGSLLGSVLAAGKSGIEAINKKRVATNKKPILSGKFWQNLKTKVGDKINVERDSEGYKVEIDAPEKPTKESDTEIANGMRAARDRFIDKETARYANDWFDRNKFYILAIVALAVFVFVMNKKK